MTTFTADPRVDAYIDSLPEWQQTICRRVRALVWLEHRRGDLDAEEVVLARFEAVEVLREDPEHPLDGRVHDDLCPHGRRPNARAHGTSSDTNRTEGDQALLLRPMGGATNG